MNLLVGVLTFGLIAFQHFELAPIGEYPLSAGFLLGAALLLLIARRVNALRVSTACAIAVVASGVAGILDPADVDPTHFARSLALLLTAVAITATAAWSTPRDDFTNAIRRGLWASLTVVVVLSVAQVATGALGQTYLFNIFGDHQYLYEYDPFLQFNPVPRAEALFLEPSYNAFVLGSLCCSLLCLGSRPLWVAVLGLPGLAAARSATGLLILAVVVAIIVVRERGAALAALVLAVPLVFFAGPYLDARIQSVGVSASSANYRVIAPLTVLQTVLTQHPFGFPQGSVQSVLQGFNLMNGASQGTSLDNGFYVVVFYFGAGGLALLLAGVALALATVRRDLGVGAHFRWIAPLWLVSSLAFSGGIFLPEFALMTWLTIICYKLGMREEGNDSRPPAPHKRYHRHLRGPGRPQQDVGVAVRA